MVTNDDKWFIFECDEDFRLLKIFGISNIEIKIEKHDQLIKIIYEESLHKFFDFVKNLRLRSTYFECDIVIKDLQGKLHYMNLGGVEFENKYVVTVFLNRFELFEELIRINNYKLNVLKEKMKSIISSTSIFQEFTSLNNEIINIQRELSKKNAKISELLKKTDEMNKKLENSNVAKDRLFSILSHDLRTPLTNTIQLIDLIIENKYNFEKVLKDGIFQLLSDSVKNSLNLIDSVLEWSRCQLDQISYNPSNFLLEKYINDIVLLYSKMALSKDIDIILDIQKTPEVFSDPRMISTVLRNIVSNAIKFTKPNGKITIATTLSEQKVKISVIDTGLGMKEEFLINILNTSINKKTTGTNGEEGSGFGLILVKELLKKNGSDLYIKSVYQEGTKIYFYLPCVQDLQ